MTGCEFSILLTVELIDGLCGGIVQDVLAAGFDTGERAILGCFDVGMRFHHGVVRPHPYARALHNLTAIGLVLLSRNGQARKHAQESRDKDQGTHTGEARTNSFRNELLVVGYLERS